MRADNSAETAPSAPEWMRSDAARGAAKIFGVIACALLLAMSIHAAQAAGLTLPFVADFSGGKLDSTWTRHLAAADTVIAARNALEFRAHANMPAHVDRALGDDFIRVSCELKSSDSSAPALLCLKWDESNFLQFGLNSPATGKLNVREVLGTYPHDYEFESAAAGDWQFIAIELARDCIRYLVSRDGKNFELVQLRPRPSRFAAAPRILILGQDAGGKIFERPNPWLAAPPTENIGVSWIRDLGVENLDKSKIPAAASERRQLAAAERDLVGEQELATPNDPTFDSVSRHFPAMKWSREIVGVKDHPFKIGVAPDGSLQLTDNIADYKKPTVFFKIGNYRYGSGESSCTKKLFNGWMPIVVASDSHEGLELRETIFGWSKNFSPDEELFGCIQFCATNPTDATVQTDLQLVFACPTNSLAPLKWHLDLPAHGGQIISARVPFKILEFPAAEITTDEFNSKLAKTTAYWDKLITTGSHFEIPEPRVENAYRAWLAYNFLNVSQHKGVYEVCDGSGFYGKVYGYSAALYCNALDLMGYCDFAEKYCDGLLSFAHTNGLLAVNFGDTDTGTALWVMAEHYRLTHDADWLRRVAPKMRLMCDWIISQRHAALANANKEPLVARGLVRYQPYADLLHPAADYFSNGYLWKGLDATAKVFAQIGFADESANFLREADDYFKDIQTSMNAAVFTDRGQKVLPMIPDSHELWKESDGSADGYYGIIAPCLLEIGLPSVEQSKLITDALEKRGGLVAGITQFHQMADHAYTYGYWMNCLQRDDAKRAILGLYGSLAYGMSRDTFTAVECTYLRTGENYWMLPHTYSNTQQLRLLRNMLVREDGDSLWLGQAIPRDWLVAGKRIAVNDAPTTFGAVSYAIEPKADGSMQVELSPPTRQRPKEIILRLRDVKQRRISRVKSVGVAKIKFSNETVRLTEVGSPVTLNVAFN